MNDLSPEEKEQIFSMAENITGNCQQGNYRREVIVSNVLRRIAVKKASSLQAYLQEAISDDKEFSHLISALTIHTTEWFREMPHFDYFTKYLQVKKIKQLKLLSAGCSTGEEVYSFSVIMETYRKDNLGFDYVINAFDIDPVSVEIAKKANYNFKDIYKIPKQFHSALKLNIKDEMFIPDQRIIEKCKFYTDNLVKIQKTFSDFDIIVCRNVLIYFTPDKVKLILKSLLERLNMGGILIIGHSDSLNAKELNLKSLGNSVFEKN